MKSPLMEPKCDMDNNIVEFFLTNFLYIFLITFHSMHC